MDVILYSKIAKMIDDTAGSGSKGNTWSADKLTEDFAGGIKNYVPHFSVQKDCFVRYDGVVLSTATDWYCSDFIDVSHAVDHKVKIKSTIYGNYASTVWYNANKGVIGYINATNASNYDITPGSDAQEYELTLPDNAVYVRANVYVISSNKISDLKFSYDLKPLDVKNKVTDISSFVGGMRWTNLVGKDKIVESAYINASTGAMIGNNKYNNAVDYIYLHPNTLYHVHNIMTTNNYAFYSMPFETAFLSDPDVILTPASADPSFDGTIQTKDTGIYFRGTFAKNKTNPYISQYKMEYEEPKLITLDNRLKVLPSFIRGKVLVMGDSISTDQYGSYKKWVTRLLEEGFLPPDTTNSSQHATGFVARYDNQANDFISRITAVQNPDKYDMVIVFGGINDYIQSVPFGGGSGETDKTVYFKPAVDYFFQYLIENFTQARICVLSPLRTYNTAQNSVGKYETDYADYIKEVAKSYCFPVLNLTDESGFCPYITAFKNMWTLIPSGYVNPDGVHPNAEYMVKYLAPMIKKFLCNL